jgi:hypothetical protein
LISWFGARHVRSKTSIATGTSPGCATQVPSWPSLASRSLSARTLASAASLATGSFLIGDLRRHAAHREGAAAVAGLDQQQRVGAQEGRHGHLLPAVRQHELRPVAREFLDEAEDVVPAAAVESDAECSRSS